MTNKKAIDLTEGNVLTQILRFIWPIFLANLFHQVYSLTNSLIVGNYVSKTALSAVSACAPMCNVCDWLLGGLALGAGITVAQKWGAKNAEETKKVIETSLLFSIFGGLLITIIVQISVPFMVESLNVQPDIHQYVNDYLRVYFLGNSAVFTYNTCFNILRSLGDSTHPLYYLIMSCVINLVLGVLFVRVFNLSVVGTALATIISQFIVDYFCLRLLLFKNDTFKFDIKHMTFSFETVKKICSLGIPAGIQNMLIAISSLLVQTYTNAFPNEVIAGLGVANRIVTLSILPTQAVSTVVVNMVAANVGAKKYDRAKTAIKTSIMVCTVMTLITSTIMMFSAEFWVSLFNKDSEVLKHGADAIRYIVYGYVPLTWSHLYNGALRGSGNVKWPMIIAVFSQCVFKYAFVYVGLKLIYDIRVIYLSTTACYAMAGILAAIYFNTSSWTKEYGMR